MAAGCGKSPYYSAEKTLPEGIWTYADTLHFPFSIQDTSKRYDLRLQIQHALPFDWQNIYVQLHTQLPNGKVLHKVKAIDFYDGRGKCLGACSGKSCSLPFMLQENMYFKEQGNYTISIEQFMRADSLKGVEKIAMALEVRD